jgi:hypothetical protein
MMGKRDGAKDNQYQGTTGTLEGNKEISHRPWYRRIRISRIGTQEGVAEEMSDIKREIKETVKGMADVTIGAVERLTFQGGLKASASAEPKKAAVKSSLDSASGQ